MRIHHTNQVNNNNNSNTPSPSIVCFYANDPQTKADAIEMDILSVFKIPFG